MKKLFLLLNLLAEGGRGLRGCDGGEGQKPPKTIQGYYFENIKN